MKKSSKSIDIIEKYNMETLTKIKIEIWLKNDSEKRLKVNRIKDEQSKKNGNGEKKSIKMKTKNGLNLPRSHSQKTGIYNKAIKRK